MCLSAYPFVNTTANKNVARKAAFLLATVDDHKTAVLKLHPPREKCNAFTETQPSQKAFDKLEFDTPPN